MVGISLALGMMALIGCDQDGGGGGSSASSKTFTDGNYTIVIEKKSQQSQNALELPADTGVAEYSISSPVSGDEFDYTLSNSGGIISRGTVKVISTSTWSFTSSSGGYTFTATFDGGSLKSFSGQITSTISGGQIGTLSPPATSKPEDSISLAGTVWEGASTGGTGRLTFTATTVTEELFESSGKTSTQGPMPYTLSGNTITITYGGMTTIITVSGNTMTIHNDAEHGGPVTLTKKSGASTEDKTGDDDFTVTNAQVYLEDETSSYTGSGTVKIGGLTVGSVTGGKLTFTLPSQVSSQYLTDISNVLTGFTVSPSNAKGIVLEGTAELYSGNTPIGYFGLMKTEGNTLYAVFYWYFDSAVKITGNKSMSGSFRTMSIDASTGWNKIYYVTTESGSTNTGTITTDLNNVPSDLKWVFASFGN
jgi:hypothetical protein